MLTKLMLEDGSEFEGFSFGHEGSVSGEVVFSTGMVGYPESLTDPSFRGQILVLTYPLIGSYGVPDKTQFESEHIQISGLIVSDYIDIPSHFESKMTLSEWLKKEKVPAIIVKDTRKLALKLRDQGVLLGKIISNNKELEFDDPNKRNLVNEVSVKDIFIEGEGEKTVLLIDCGAKMNIKRSLLKRKVKLITVPWDYPVFESDLKFDSVVISNGPGDPKMVKKTIETVKKVLKKNIPILGICLGNQILALAAEGDTYKMRFGHRSQNQPCILKGTNKCFLTTQNHGFAVGKLPFRFEEWFVNANDGTNEGIRHKKLPIMSVQFHPEACPGPTDTEWVFDEFLKIQ